MPLGTRVEEGALASTYLENVLGGRYMNTTPQARASHVWSDADSRTHCAFWLLERAQELATEAEEAFDRAAVLADLNERLIARAAVEPRGDAARARALSSVTGGAIFDSGYDALVALVASWG
jgi:hypothetical protein